MGKFQGSGARCQERDLKAVSTSNSPVVHKRAQSADGKAAYTPRSGVLVALARSDCFEILVGNSFPQIRVLGMSGSGAHETAAVAFLNLPDT
jgi:hypothetical protein